MSDSTFRLYLVYFRLLRIMRVLARSLNRANAKYVPRLRSILREVRAGLLLPLWLSLELFILAWEYVEGQVWQRFHAQLRTWHRGLFCIALSLCARQVFLLLIPGFLFQESSLVLALVSAMAIFLLWKRGARWCRSILGVRPLRRPSKKDQYGGLDLGN